MQPTVQIFVQMNSLIFTHALYTHTHMQTVHTRVMNISYITSLCIYSILIVHCSYSTYTHTGTYLWKLVPLQLNLYLDWKCLHTVSGTHTTKSFILSAFNGWTAMKMKINNYYYYVCCTVITWYLLKSTVCLLIASCNIESVTKKFYPTINNEKGGRYIVLAFWPYLHGSR